jgi:hypothetical protein
MQSTAESNSADVPSMIALSKWQRQVGINASTAWRWRQRGWLKTLNIAGRAYLTRVEAERFLERARAGEFATVQRPQAWPATGKQ